MSTKGSHLCVPVVVVIVVAIVVVEVVAVESVHWPPFVVREGVDQVVVGFGSVVRRLEAVETTEVIVVVAVEMAVVAFVAQVVVA